MEGKERAQARRRKHRHVLCRRLSMIVMLLCLVLVVGRVLPMLQARLWEMGIVHSVSNGAFEKEVAAFAEKHDLPRDAWPQDMIEKVETNPELAEFVLNYPIKKDEHPKIDLNKYKGSKSVPLLMQWDDRWGYDEYAGNIIGFAGCGPTCLSMVSIYLLDNTDYDPRYMAKFSEDNGYSAAGSGSSWSLISEGGQKLGIDVTELPLERDRIFRNLEAGNPIICVMGPGDFTSTGHFIVLTGVEDGKLTVNDPNSRERSKKLWEYENIKGQIKNLWACR